MALVGMDIVEKWARANRIREEFYAEKAKADTLLEEALILCNNTSELRTKKSIVRSTPRLKLNTVGNK